MAKVKAGEGRKVVHPNGMILQKGFIVEVDEQNPYWARAIKTGDLVLVDTDKKAEAPALEKPSASTPPAKEGAK